MEIWRNFVEFFIFSAVKTLRNKIPLLSFKKHLTFLFQYNNIVV